MRLTQFLYFHETLSQGQTQGGFSIDRPVSQLKSLDLSYKDYVFGFEFSALHFANPQRNKYAYKMENWDINNNQRIEFSISLNDISFKD